MDDRDLGLSAGRPAMAYEPLVAKKVSDANLFL
jgi:hypothetical protein